MVQQVLNRCCLLTIQGKMFFEEKKNRLRLDWTQEGSAESEDPQAAGVGQEAPPRRCEERARGGCRFQAHLSALLSGGTGAGHFKKDIVSYVHTGSIYLPIKIVIFIQK